MITLVIVRVLQPASLFSDDERRQTRLILESFSALVVRPVAIREGRDSAMDLTSIQECNDSGRRWIRQILDVIANYTIFEGADSWSASIVTCNYLQVETPSGD